MDHYFKTTNTSFIKASHNSKILQIKGAKLSSRVSQHVISTGLDSLDYFIGGGLPVGSLLFVEEGASSQYTSYFLKHYVAEGIASDHHIFLAGGQSKELISGLPRFSDYLETSSSFIQPKGIDKSMDDYTFTPFSHSFDLSSTIPEDIIKKAKITYKEETTSLPTKTILNLPEPYHTVLTSIWEKLQHFAPEEQAEKKEKELLRVVLNLSLTPSQASLHSQTINSRFLWLLRAMVKKSFATALVVLPASFQDWFNHLEQFGDICLRVEPFTDEKGEKVTIGGFQGLVHFTRLSSLEFLLWPTPNLQGLAFSLTSNRFSIKKFNQINPDDEENNEE